MKITEVHCAIIGRNPVVRLLTDAGLDGFGPVEHTKPWIVEALMDRGVAVFAINPKQLDRFRDRFSPAGAKDDRRDALVLALSLRTDRHCFRRVEAMDPAVIELREWSRMAEELKGERVRLSNRVRQQLWRYYSQFFDLTDDIGAEWVLA